MFKLKVETVPIGVQGQRDNVAKGGMPGDGLVSRFVVLVCDSLFLPLADFIGINYRELPEKIHRQGDISHDFWAKE
jgi:hypothetical protein